MLQWKTPKTVTFFFGGGGIYLYTIITCTSHTDDQWSSFKTVRESGEILSFISYTSVCDAFM